MFQGWFRQKVQEAMEAKGVTMAELSRRSGIDNSYLKRILEKKEGSRLNEDHIEAIAKALDIRIVEPAREPYPVSITYTKKFGDPTLPQSREADYLPVPIVEPRVAAGNPETVSSEQIVDIAYIHRRTLKRKNVQDYLCTFVQGDSMFPVLRDGAIVCIDTKARPEGKKTPKWSIWAVRKDDGAVVKNIQIADNAIVLISANPNYPPDIVNDPDAIIGKVVWMWQAV
jgi:phage repressor protein C with HTH and peptisase S24 domain